MGWDLEHNLWQRYIPKDQKPFEDEVQDFEDQNRHSTTPGNYILIFQYGSLYDDNDASDI